MNVSIDELRNWVSLAKQTNTASSYATALDVAMQLLEATHTAYEAARADANRYNKMVEKRMSINRWRSDPTQTPVQIKIELDKFIDES